MHFNSGPPPPTGVTAVQDGPTSITVTWTPPDPLDGTTGYTISYTGSGSEAVSGGSTNSYTLIGLTNGQTYTISIVATSSGLSSAPVQATVGLGMLPFGSCVCVCGNISAYVTYMCHDGVLKMCSISY